jgi:hypothetical protein
LQYVRYLAGLYKIAERTVAIQSRLSFNDVMIALEPVWKMKFEGDDKAIQRAHSQLIARIAWQKGLCSRAQIEKYIPEEDRMYWKQFWPRHRLMLLPEGPEKIFSIVRKCGEDWAK